MSTATHFRLDGPLPAGIAVLEASAGTGKTYAIAGLAARYVALEGARLPRLLIVTLVAFLPSAVEANFVDSTHLLTVHSRSTVNHEAAEPGERFRRRVAEGRIAGDRQREASSIDVRLKVDRRSLQLEIAQQQLAKSQDDRQLVFQSMEARRFDVHAASPENVISAGKMSPSRRRACAAAFDLRSELADLGGLETSTGPVTLQMSIGVHSGGFDFFLVGDSHRELVLAGPGATTTNPVAIATSATLIEPERIRTP